jgi:aminoglycoside phosphotransferase family enzyme/predicted kinase
MVTEDQNEVVAFLSSPATHGGAPVERIETHASIVFLAGTRAWKLKRAVRYDYLDFSTVERRRAMCEAEVRINRRTAPDLYRGVVAVTRHGDGALALGGPGTPVDWLVEMVRFDQQGLLDQQAARGTLDLDLMRPLAAAIARFHESAERRFDHGGTPGMTWVVEGNAAGFAEQGAGIFDPAAGAELTRRSREELGRHGSWLDARRAAGFVRQCHGDLHLRNIVLLEGRPTLFDAIEFNDEIACTDVLYDLAFLLMDLWRRRLPRHANVIWNGYLAETADAGGIPLLPLFLSCRAAVRAKTSATAARLQSDARRRGELENLAREYLAMAQQLLQPPPPSLIAVGGYSGSGKSTVARALAPAIGRVPGAVVIRSDEIRKRLCGVGVLQRLGPAGYTAEVSRRVYDALAQQAAQIVSAGHAAIADAVYARPADREAIERAAAVAHVPFVGLWLEAPEAVLIARSEQRRLDPSDADAAVIRQQLGQEPGPMAWHRIDASGTVADVLSAATAVLAEHLALGAFNEASERD